MTIGGLAESQELGESTTPATSHRGKRPTSHQHAWSPIRAPRSPLIDSTHMECSLVPRHPPRTHWLLDSAREAPQGETKSLKAIIRAEMDSVIRSLTPASNQRTLTEQTLCVHLSTDKETEAQRGSRSLSLQGGSKPWAMLAQELGWKGSMCLSS